MIIQIEKKVRLAARFMRFQGLDRTDIANPCPSSILDDWSFMVFPLPHSLCGLCIQKLP
jgi:hypothetical protein